MQQLAPTPRHPLPVAPPAAYEVRVAPLVRQSVRRDGAFEFVAVLIVVSLIVVASLAYVRGTPVKPAQPAASPAPATAPAAH